MRLHMILPSVETPGHAGAQRMPLVRQPARRSLGSRWSNACATPGWSRCRPSAGFAVRADAPGASIRWASPMPTLAAPGRHGGHALPLGPLLWRGRPRAGGDGPSLLQEQRLAAVEAAAARVPGLAARADRGSLRTPALAGDLMSVRVKGKWLPRGMPVADLSGQVLTIDACLTGEDAATLKEWITPVAEQVGARLLITDDADSFKQVAAALGLPRWGCRNRSAKRTSCATPTRSLPPCAPQPRWTPMAPRARLA